MEDLRTIKNQKHREGIVVSGFVPAGLGQGRRSSTELHEEPYLSVSSAALLNTSNSKQGQGDDEYKTKFLIVTYKAEFDWLVIIDFTNYFGSFKLRIILYM